LYYVISGLPDARAHTYDLVRARWGDRRTLFVFYAAAVILGALGILIGLL